MLKMLKRIILTVLIISLVAAVPVTQGFAADTVSSSENEEPYEGEALVEKLGIISAGVDENSDYVTREVFSLYIARMLKIDEMETSDKRYFSDVEYDSFAVSAINGLVDNGIISVPEDHLFRPGDYITYTEAIKMLVCTLGYQAVAENLGGYPSGYTKTANMLSINVNCANSEVITVAEAGSMIYKSLRASVQSANGVTVEDGISYLESEDRGESFLEVYWDILEAEGSIEAIYGGDVVKSSAVLDENEVVISNVKFEVEDGLDLSDCLGNKVRYFYKERENEK